MTSTNGQGHTKDGFKFRGNDGDIFSCVGVVQLATRLNEHISTLSPVCNVPLRDWNSIASDFQSATQLLVGIANDQRIEKLVAFAQSIIEADSEGHMMPKWMANDARTALSRVSGEGR